ncbi:unnamed protein product [Leptosia nina]|uniref:Strictosidine synthase conserved region domain-containing protein n=1 Tax=Leptosia nina TaxID=320188 RepID=A0AAV1JM51_9NEOP
MANSTGKETNFVVMRIILLIPNLPPYTKFSKIPIAPTKDHIGALEPNSALNNAAQLYEGKIQGPEVFQILNGELYTSLGTGEIVKCSSGGHVTFVTKLGQPCTGLTQEHICGRPLGFSIDENKHLMYVADAYYGIWRVDLKTDKKQALVTPDVPIEGKKPKLFNSVAVDKKGGVYWTDSSSDFPLKDGVFIGLSDPSGRLLYYSPETKKSKVLFDNMWFANGVALSPDESFVVVAETMQYRILKYYISGPKKGKTEVFVDGLPGTPDNIRALPDGSGLQIALYSASDDKTPLIAKTVSDIPPLRKFIARAARLIEMPFEFLNTQFPHYIFEEIIYFIGNFASLSGLSDISGLVVTDWNGNIIASYYNTDKSVAHISDAIVYNNKLLLGSPHSQNFIAAVEVPSLLKQAYTPSVKQNVHQKTEQIQKPKAQARETTTTDKPTTTQKPVTTNKPEQKVNTEASITQKPVAKPTTPEQKVVTEKPTTEKPKTTKPEQKKVTKKPANEIPSTPEQKITTEKPTTQKPITKTSSTEHPHKSTPASQPQKVQSSEAPKPKIKPNIVKEPEANLKQKSKPSSEDNKPTSKPVKSENVKVKNEQINNKEAPPKKDIPKHIPIEEEIVSDTLKPSKDKLKVIKKSGPEEIPNPRI